MEFKLYYFCWILGYGQVIKPSVIGGFENAASIARWAQQQGKMAVVSAAFESGLGLSAYILFSCYLELQNADLCKVMNRELAPPMAHGLGTYQWLKEDVTTHPIGICYNPCSGLVEASVANAAQLMQKFQINHKIIRRTFTEEQVSRDQLIVNSKDVSSSIKVLEIGERVDVSRGIIRNAKQGCYMLVKYIPMHCTTRLVYLIFVSYLSGMVA